jgi:hypothetical protein
MRCSLRVVGFIVLLAVLGTLAGCTKPVLRPRDKPPPDPLLTSKKPIEGNPSTGDARPVPAEDYAPPPRPVVEDEPGPVRMLGVRRIGDGR